MQLSFVQDADFPEVSFRMKTPSTKYYSRVIRVVEMERNNQTYLEVKCDVIVEYKISLLAVLSGAAKYIEAEHIALLHTMKVDMEAQQRKRETKSGKGGLRTSHNMLSENPCFAA